MINELKLRNRSEQTIKSYVDCVYGLAKRYMRDPAELSVEEIRDYLRHLAGERKLSPNTVNVAFNAIVFRKRHKTDPLHRTRGLR